MKKKMLGMVVGTVVMASAFAACGGSNSTDTQSQAGGDDALVTEQQEANSENSDFNYEKYISVVSREDGSGTRGAFIELTGVEEKNDAGEKVDNTVATAAITNNTSVMMSTIAGDVYGIGYISLGSLNDEVKALQVDGVEATAENVKAGTYTLARPFNVVTMGDLSPVAQDFMNFIMSEEGQQVVVEEGYVDVAAESFETTSPSGTLMIAGSSSVSPVMEKLKEAYVAINPNATIEIQTNDSTTGVEYTISGVCEIGMASRNLKDSEVEQGVTATTIAMDGIAVIVNNGNPMTSITTEQIKAIYTGNVEKWAELQ